MSMWPRSVPKSDSVPLDALVKSNNVWPSGTPLSGREATAMVPVSGGVTEKVTLVVEDGSPASPSPVNENVCSPTVTAPVSPCSRLLRREFVSVPVQSSM